MIQNGPITESPCLKGGALFSILDTLHTALSAHSLYFVDNLDFSMWSMNSRVCIDATTGYLVQLFDARQVYIISKNVVVPVIVAILGGTCCVVLSFDLRSCHFLGLAP